MQQTIQTLEPLLTFKEVMRYLRVSRSTLLRMMQAGQIPAHKVGASWRFVQSEVQALLIEPVSTEQGKPDA